MKKKMNHFPKFISHLFNEFLNHKSDASPMEASVQENMEKEFATWLKNHDSIEADLLSVVNTMCEESLPLNTFTLWEIVLRTLYSNRRSLKYSMLPSSLSKKQKYPELSTEQQEYLQNLLAYHHESGSIIPADHEIVQEAYSSILDWLLKE